MIDESITCTLADGTTLPLHTTPLTQEELDEIIGDDLERGRFEGIFRVPLSALIESDGEYADEIITDACVLDNSSYNLAYAIEDWSYEVVGFEAGTNVLYMYVTGDAVVI